MRALQIPNVGGGVAMELPTSVQFLFVLFVILVNHNKLIEMLGLRKEVLHWSLRRQDY